MRVTGGGAAVAVPEAVSSVVGANSGSGWGEVFEQALSGANRSPRAGAGADLRLKQLSEMIKLQMDVCRYQVKVELVSKVSESGVASVRKLQQSQ